MNQFTTPKPNLEPSYELSYLLGVLKGDACIYRTRNGKHYDHIIQLAVTDKEFAEYFVEILEKIFCRRVSIINYRDDRNRLFYKVVIRSKLFYEWYKSNIQYFIYEIARKFPNAFVKGVFDSEGNLCYFQTKYKEKIYLNPVVRLCSSDRDLIETIQKWIITYYNISGKITVKPSGERVINGRLCRFSKDVYILTIHNKENIQAFFKNIGTSIPRKNMEVE